MILSPWKHILYSGLFTLAIAMGASAIADNAPIAVQAADKTVTLSLPDKTCAYDKNEKTDAAVLNAIERSNPKSQLLLAFIDCENLKLGRGQKTTGYASGFYGQILSDIAGQAVADRYTREQYVKAIADTYKERPEQALAHGEEKLKALVASQSDTASAETIGMIRREPDFIQIAIIGMEPMPGGMRKVMNIVTVTKLGVPVAIYLGYPVRTDVSLADLSARAELYTRQLLDANPESGAMFPHGFDKWSAIVGAVAGFVIGILLSRLFKSR